MQRSFVYIYLLFVYNIFRIVLNKAVNDFPADEKYKIEVKEELRQYKEWIINECKKEDEELSIFSYKRKNMEGILSQIKVYSIYYYLYNRKMSNLLINIKEMK